MRLVRRIECQFNLNYRESWTPVTPCANCTGAPAKELGAIVS
ncbi:hypothetical protein CfE428DRAFT_1400 [Chthoniobacter flavus Ellin428]|uniref:Uncharacterized protein n=1 Tax=Chthoniobacter flavus Ellin428 TaxID=497964 RepID=B4CXV9_9BACT|nr:hypothetical protein CfE428DRAFT_1400 [Chthoniobacter flavus Ellin428]TCO83604.1 hypothetical protein EV701_14116 [Chthoniobacter flavus]